MTIKSSLYFMFNGINSQDMGILNVNVSQGMYEEPFLASRTIHEVKIRGNDKPYYQYTELSPIEFSVSFALQDSFDQTKLRQIARWLNVSYFCPLVFSDDPDKIYFAMPVNDSSLIHTGTNGYINLKFRTNAPYAYSPSYTQTYDFSSNVAGGTLFQFTNNGDLSVFPKLYIQKVGDGDISIFNYSNGGIEFKFTGLLNGENLFVDSTRQYISTDQNNLYRYSNFNNNWLELLYGVNNLNVVGNCKLKFVWEYRILQ
ncbi:distal tail protein Dit [Paenibacillus cremeus]|uniref:Phage tail protein n=1 Tax=Paenibacillus cremeus TaxID=2163881 RepID=A0A559KCZ2_9BACL|nr:distal tail protein Dit [Paenibacillus cremeus]TVY09985.1 phage tail protein [Paenibacillus cremeus]